MPGEDGRVHLEQQAVDHDQVTHCQLPSRYALGCHDHGKGKGSAEDSILAQIEP